MRTLVQRVAVTLAAVLCIGGATLAAPASSTTVPTPAAGVPAHHPDLVLVGFEAGTPAAVRAATHLAHGSVVVNTLDWMDVDVVRTAPGLDPVGLSALYRDDPYVEYAHPNWKMSLLRTANDTLFKDEWGLHNTGQSVTGSLVRGVADVDIDAPEGWDTAFGTGAIPATGGTRVGIIDTGIDRSHADLLNKTKTCATAITGTGTVVSGSCSDDNVHGTHVAGTIGAVTDNTLGVAGVAPNAEFGIFKALDAAGTGFYADVIAGVHWMHTAGGVKIVSMSIGGPRDDALDRELTEAAAAGLLLIAAAGNDGDSTANYPAFHRDVMSVGAVDAAGKRASFSNCNSDVEIAAPGVDVWSTVPGNAYAALSGTSMATPHVSGVAALIMSVKGSDAASTRSTLKSSAQGNGGCNGTGIANLAAALGGGGTPPPPTSPGAIAGTVTDARTKSGIGAATVNCGSAGTATTNTSGQYSLTNVPPSTYTCTASASGYRNKSASVTVTSGATTTANFGLRAA